MPQINVSEEGLQALKQAFATYGETYKNDLTRLNNIISEITSGDIQGDPAVDLLSKYEAKQDVFNNIAKTIDEAEEYMGLQNNKFNNTISNLASGMK